MHRNSAQDSWQEAQDITNSFSGGNFSQSDKVQLPSTDTQAGDWQMKVHVTVECWDGDTKEVWRGQAEREFDQHFSPADIQQRQARLAKIEREQRAAFAESQINKPAPGETALIAGKKYIAKMQYATDAGHTWHDVPSPGSPDYPLVIQQYDVIGLRAVAESKTKWPNWPDLFPQWQVAGTGELDGETVYVQLPVPRNTTDLQTVSVRCGNQVSAKFRVLPNADLVVYSSRGNLAVGRQRGTMATTCRLTALCNLEAKERQGAQVHFFARYADGSPADVINSPGANDDAATLDKNGSAHLILRGGSKAGQLNISALVVSPQGQQLASTEHDEIVNVRAGWWLKEHGDQP